MFPRPEYQSPYLKQAPPEEIGWCTQQARNLVSRLGLLKLATPVHVKKLGHGVKFPPSGSQVQGSCTARVFLIEVGTMVNKQLDRSNVSAQSCNVKSVFSIPLRRIRVCSHFIEKDT